MNTIGRIILLAGIIIPFHLLHAQSGLETQAQLQALEQTEPTAAATVSVTGRFYPASLANQGIFAPIYPSNLGHPAWNLGDVVWLVDDLPTASGRGMRAMGMDGSGGPFPGGGGTNDYGDGGDYTNNYVRYTFDTNQLWLEVTNISGGTVFANLHNATNLVYAIWSTTDLTTPFAGWQVETEVWPSDTNCQPFNLPTLDRQNLFLRAEDWTGVDSDGDGVPDWWSWLYWATNNLPDTNLDYSGSSDTFAQDYSNSITPTVFSFTGIDVTNNYVSTMSAAAQLDVSGSPYYIAISMDDTNYAADAVWEDYSGSNVMVNLGITEGWHDVWIGLRGHGDDPTNAVWQWKRLKLDETPPLLVVTNPTVSTVSVPLVQIQGYSPEEIASISYDLTNALGLVTNQDAGITEQFYSTNTYEYTTNWFECVDVPLTNGLNVITLHATDMAGNTTTTNISITLDYSSRTNPPAVNLYWPQDGTLVCNSNYTWRGWVDDPTASVVAQLVDTNGDTNIFNGMVERDGKFWVENLPMNGGTNWLTLTVTDSAGNVAVTNIAVFPGAVNLTIAMPSDDQLWSQGLTVNGTIDDSSDYTVWVNGVKAAFNDDGSWTATNVYLPKGGTALIQARAIPNSDNDGNGSGGGGPVTYDSLGNPDPPADNDSEIQTNRPARLYVEVETSDEGFHEFDDWEEVGGPDYTTVDTTRRDNYTWTDGQTSHAHGTFSEVVEDYIYGSGESDLDTAVTWPASYYPNVSTPSITFTGDGNHRSSYYRNPFFMGHFIKYQGHWFVGPWPYADGLKTFDNHWDFMAETTMKLQTGGKGQSKRQNLFKLSATAERYSPPNEDGFGFDGFKDIGGISAQDIQILGQNLNTNGYRYKILPDNDTREVTPYVKGVDYYTFTEDKQKYLSYYDLYVQQANPGYSFLPVGDNDYGHAFWQFRTEAPGDALQYLSTNLTRFLGTKWGFYPTNNPPPNLWNFEIVQGFLQNDGPPTPHPYNIKRTFYIGLPDLISGLQFTKDIYNNPPNWSATGIDGYSCVDAARVAGFYADVFGLPWDSSPQNFGVTLIQMYPPVLSSDPFDDETDVFYSSAPY